AATVNGQAPTATSSPTPLPTSAMLSTASSETEQATTSPATVAEPGTAIPRACAGKSSPDQPAETTRFRALSAVPVNVRVAYGLQEKAALSGRLRTSLQIAMGGDGLEPPTSWV